MRNSGGTFQVQQTQVLLIIEIAFLGVMFAVWYARRRSDSHYVDLYSVSQQQRGKWRGGSRRASRAVREAARDVPIPWGWPNCAYYRRRRNKLTVSESLYQLADVLLKEKQLVSEAPVDPRIANSLRALIEDRYHPVDRDRDAAETTGGALDDIWYVGPVVETRRAAEKKLNRARDEIKELRTPWGW